MIPFKGREFINQGFGLESLLHRVSLGGSWVAMGRVVSAQLRS